MVHKTPKERLEKELELYKSECRYLINSSAKYPTASGVFRLGNTYYTTRNLEHMTSIEAQLCLNQLCYYAFGEWLTEGIFDESIDFGRYLELMKENMFIIDSNIKFRKPIPTESVVHGKITLTKIKKHNGLYLAFLDYDLEQEKSTGSMKLALKI